MANPSTQDTIYTFPDRAIRKLQAVPAHLRELVQEVAPNVAPHLRFEQAQQVGGKLPLADWREVEPDLLFEIPLDWPGAAEAMLVCVLLEHQSKPAQRMPLRVLQYAVAYWGRRADVWEKNHQRGDQLTLPPVLPIVLYTGERPWDVQRSLTDLFAGPAELLAYQPQWARGILSWVSMTRKSCYKGRVPGCRRWRWCGWKRKARKCSGKPCGSCWGSWSPWGKRRRPA